MAIHNLDNGNMMITFDSYLRYLEVYRYLKQSGHRIISNGAMGDLGISWQITMPPESATEVMRSRVATCTPIRYSPRSQA